MDRILKQHVDILGLRVKDKVTGFAGVASSVSFDLYGCVQCILRPTVKDGKLEDGRWMDVQRLVLLNDARIMPLPSFDALATPEGVHTHGPAEKPIR